MKALVLSAIALASVGLCLLGTVHAQSASKQTPQAKPAEQKEDDGQKIFEQNCSRCHHAPEGFSPRISGTIVRHMRVRANLSREDEQKLLRFFNP